MLMKAMCNSAILSWLTKKSTSPRRPRNWKSNTSPHVLLNSFGPWIPLVDSSKKIPTRDCGTMLVMPKPSKRLDKRYAKTRQIFAGNQATTMMTMMVIKLPPAPRSLPLKFPRRGQGLPQQAQRNQSATAAPAARVPATATAPAPRAPVSGRGPIQHHLSWHSSGSSTFGMPLPQQGPSMPSQGYPPQPTPAYSSAGSGVSMPATHSSGSAQHLLKPAGTLLNPAQLYQGMRNVSNRATGTLSKRAAEIMQFQNLQAQAQAHRQAHPGMRYPSGQPEEVAFGRNFTPTDLSSGSTMSTISDTSGFSNAASNLTGSALGGAAPSALSLGSSGMGPPATAGRGPRVPSSTQTMTSFMSSAGLSRSLSFGDSDVYSVGNTPMSDASFIALLAEDKAIGDILSTLPPLVSSNTSSKSSSNQFNSAFASSAMSVTSSGSNKSMMNVSTRSAASENSWLHPYQRSYPKEQFDAMWPDDRSMMSDVSERILALDLALPSQM